MSGPDPLHSALAQWTVGALTTQILWTRCLGAAAITAAQRQRLRRAPCACANAFAVLSRPWRDLPPARRSSPTCPVVTKSALMCVVRRLEHRSRDPWRDVEAFIGTRAHIGERFRDRYLVWTSSGTTGKPGVFLQDAAALRRVRRTGVGAGRRDLRSRGCDWHAAARRRTRGADHRRGRSFRRASRRGGGQAQRQAVARHEELRGDASGAPIGRRAQRLRAGVRLELSDDAGAARRRAEGGTVAPQARGPVVGRRSAVASAQRPSRPPSAARAQRIRRLGMPVHRLCLPRARAAYERGLGGAGAGRSRLQPHLPASCRTRCC